MFAWIADNIVTIIICIVLIAVIAAIIAGLVKNRKKGKSSCGCNCGCHAQRNKHCDHSLLNKADCRNSADASCCIRV